MGNCLRQGVVNKNVIKRLFIKKPKNLCINMK